jgi:putative PIN family toxin of toxin-antitoxin system
MIWVSYCTRREGYRHQLLERAHRERVRLFVSTYILDELSNVLGQHLKRSPRYIVLARHAVLRMAKLVALPQAIPRHVPGDPADDPIVQTALSAKADYLVTGDHELLNLKKVQDVEILTAQQFEQRLPPAIDL